MDGNKKEKLQTAKVAFVGNSAAGKSSLVAIFLKIMKTSPQSYEEILREITSTVGM